MSAATLSAGKRGAASVRERLRRVPQLDLSLLLATLALMALGLVMVTSASMTIADRQLDQPFHYALRQAVYIVLGLGLGLLTYQIRPSHWAKAGMVSLFLACSLLILVLVPGIGREVNGSTRWISLGLFNLQVSEPAKLLILVYLSSYLVRRSQEVRTRWSGFVKPMLVLSLVCALLLREPDFGAATVLLATAMGMLFLAGVRWWQFLMVAGGAALAMAGLIISSEYRMQRWTAFLNPWADPFDSGFQLTQSLIAIGRGDIFGVGLGASVQKLFYLPEAHTDFVFAVLAEELGLIGVLAVIALYAFVVWRACAIAAVALRANEHFSGYLAYGIAIWIALQSLINIGVNMGLLPTKGLTLPFMSYGGSSLLVMSAAIAMLLRIDYETRCTVHNLPAKRTPSRVPGNRTRKGSETKNPRSKETAAPWWQRLLPGGGEA